MRINQMLNTKSITCFDRLFNSIFLFAYWQKKDQIVTLDYHGKAGNGTHHTVTGKAAHP